MSGVKKKRIDCKLVYLKQDEKYSSGEEIEDHIVPMVQNYLIDFVWTQMGVSHRVRKSNLDMALETQTNPEIIPIQDFKNKYSKWGYFDSEEISYQDAFGNSGKCLTIEKPNIKNVKA